SWLFIIAHHFRRFMFRSHANKAPILLNIKIAFGIQRRSLRERIFEFFVHKLRSIIQSIQSAMKTFVSPFTFPLRFEAKTSFLPSGENIGKPSKVSLYVMRSRPVPSTLMA